MIVIIDFGSQTCHLIGRRIKNLGIDVEIIPAVDASASKIKSLDPSGIILSGGPMSIYEKGAPTISQEILLLKTPILGICYGLHTIAHLLGGNVQNGSKEFGPAKLNVISKSPLFLGLPNQQNVWMSHGDEIKRLPKNFVQVAKTQSIPYAAIANEREKIYAVQFHPEVSHTEYGLEILKNFLRICNLKPSVKTIDVEEITRNIYQRIGKNKAIAAVSGGVDSTVAAVLVAHAIGKNFYPIYIESGLMRLGTKEEVKKIFRESLDIKPIIINAKKLFIESLKDVNDPERKRKIIGKLFIDLFTKQAKKIKNVKFLVQGTIYSDFIESKGTHHANKIKSHHNVGGLPKNLKFEIIEPLREFYKDEVRQIGTSLNLPIDTINKHPFPGPGQAIRIIGEVTARRLKTQQQADKIVIEEIKKFGWYEKVFQVFPVLTNTKSTAIKGDGRFYGEVIAIRCYNSTDIMTTDWTKLPYDLLQKLSSRIVNELPEVSRVVYDITTKPPATMEWE